MKPIEDRGNVAAATKPLRVRRYDAGHLPDPGECVDSLIAVNDRTRPGSASLRFSDGSSWLDCTPGLAAAAPQSMDVTLLVQQAVRDAVPAALAALPRPVAPMALPAPAMEQRPDENATLARAMLELAELVNDLQRRLHAAEARIDQLERMSVSHVEIKGAAA